MIIEDRLDKIEEKLDAYLILGSRNQEGKSLDARDEIDLREMFEIAWQNKWMIVALTTVFAVASFFYAKSLPNIYKAEAVLAPSVESQGGGIAALAGKFGGFASLAGVNLGQNGSDKTVIAMEVVKSRRFINAFIERYDLLIPLMAAKNWDAVSDKLIIDEKVYDEESGKWVRTRKSQKSPEPSAWEAYKKFKSILDISRDKPTNLIIVSIEHYSPVLAREWTANLVKEINLHMRASDVAEATKSIEYLTEKLNSTSIADMRVVFSQMIEEQMKVMMLAEVRDEYVFSTLDPAVVPEEKDRPRKAIICFMGTVLGGMLGLFILLLKCFFRE